MFAANNAMRATKGGDQPIAFVGYRFAYVGYDVAGSVTVPLTGLSGGIAGAAKSGDLVVVAANVRAAGDWDISVSTAGYTEVCDLFANDSKDAQLMVAYKRIGSGDASVTVTHNIGVNVPILACVYVFRFVNVSTPLDVAVQTATGINTGRPTPPAITPVTPGSVILVIASSATDGNDAASLLAQSGAQLSNFAADAGYDNTASWTVHLAIGAYYAWASGAFSPAALVGADTSTNSSWAAAALALRPK